MPSDEILPAPDIHGIEGLSSKKIVHVSGGCRRVQEAPELAGIGPGHDGYRRPRAAPLLAHPGEADDGVSNGSLLAAP